MELISHLKGFCVRNLLVCPLIHLILLKFLVLHPSLLYLHISAPTESEKPLLVTTLDLTESYPPNKRAQLLTLPIATSSIGTVSVHPFLTNKTVTNLGPVHLFDRWSSSCMPAPIFTAPAPAPCSAAVAWEEDHGDARRCLCAAARCRRRGPWRARSPPPRGLFPRERNRGPSR